MFYSNIFIFEDQLKSTEKKIDNLIYELYNLTPNEIEIIENIINKKQ